MWYIYSHTLLDYLLQRFVKKCFLFKFDTRVLSKGNTFASITFSTVSTQSSTSRSQLYQHSLQHHVLNCINIVFNITFSTVSTQSSTSRSQLYQYSLQHHVLNCINIVFNICVTLTHKTHHQRMISTTLTIPFIHMSHFLSLMAHLHSLINKQNTH